MIDLKLLRADPNRFKQGARDKGVDVDIERLVRLDEEIRGLKTDMENRRAEQNRISKEIGPQIGKLKGQLKSAQGAERDALETKARELEQKPHRHKTEIQAFKQKFDSLTPEFESLLLEILSDYQVSIPEIGTVKARRDPPLVFLTSNNTREFPPAQRVRSASET